MAKCSRIAQRQRFSFVPNVSRIRLRSKHVQIAPDKMQCSAAHAHACGKNALESYKKDFPISHGLVIALPVGGCEFDIE